MATDDDERVGVTSTSPVEKNDGTARYAVGVLYVPDLADPNGDRLRDFANAMSSWIASSIDGLRWAWDGVTESELHAWITEQPVSGDGATEDDPELALAVAKMKYDHPEHYRRRILLGPLLEEARRSRRGLSRPELKIANRPGMPFLTGRVTLHDASLEAKEGGAPASVEMRSTLLATDGTLRRSTWLLAEGGQAVKPSVREVPKMALWAAFVSPAVLAHVVVPEFLRLMARVRDPEAAPSSRVTAAVALPFAAVLCSVGSLLVTAATQLYLGLLAAVSVVPLDAVKEFVSAQLESRTAGIAAAGFALEQDATSRAATLTELGETMAWMNERCEALVIVGRGFGAVAAHEALRRRIPGRLRLVFDVGSAEPLLSRLRPYASPFSTQTIVTALSMLFSMSSVWLLVHALERHDHWRGVLLVAGAICLVFYLLLFAMASSQSDGDDSWAWNKVLNRRGVEWCGVRSWGDVLAQQEPPNPLQTGLPVVETIHNRGPLEDDRGAYLANGEECLHQLLAKTVEKTCPEMPLHELTAVDAFVAAEWRERRAWRVGWLTRGQLIVLAGLVLGIIVRRADLPALGLRIVAMVRDSILAVGAWTGLTIPWAPLEGQQPLALGAGAVFAGGFVAYALVRLAWRVWDICETALFLRRAGGRPNDGGFVITLLPAIFYGLVLARVLAKIAEVAVLDRPMVPLHLLIVHMAITTCVLWSRFVSRRRR